MMHGKLYMHYKNNADPNAIKEMQEAVGQGKVITDLSDIFRAAKEGRGDLLIAHDDFHQAVKNDRGVFVRFSE